MAALRTISLAIPYRIRVEPGTEISDAELTKARIRMTEQFILGAAGQLYPQGLNRKQAKTFRAVAEALAEEAESVTLDGSEFDFLWDLFFSREAEDTVRFAPAAAAWFEQWLDHLKVVHQG